MKSKLIKQKNHFQIICEKKAIKETTNEAGDVTGIEIEGFASTKDKDRVNDIVEPKAFAEALELYMTNPIMLLQHKADKPIGTVVEATIKSNGLYVKANITEDIDGIFSKLKNGVVRAFSIGYRVRDWEELEVKDENDNVTGYEVIIKSLELYEISLVSIPANPYALLKSVDSLFELQTKDEADATTEDKEEIVADEPSDTVEEKPAVETDDEQGEAETIEAKEEVEETETVETEETETETEEVEEEKEETEEKIEEDDSEEAKELETEEKRNGDGQGPAGNGPGTGRGTGTCLKGEEGTVKDVVEDAQEEEEEETLGDKLEGANEEINPTEEEEKEIEEEEKEEKEEKDNEVIEQEAVEAEKKEETKEDVVPVEETEEKEEEEKEDEVIETAENADENKEPEVVEEGQESENADETVADEVETDPVEEVKDLEKMAIKNIEGLVKTGNEDVMKEVKNLFEKKDEVIEGLSKKLENSIEIIKGLVDYLETIDKQLANTIVKSGVPFEKIPAKRKSAYGKVVDKCKTIL